MLYPAFWRSISKPEILQPDIGDVLAPKNAIGKDYGLAAIALAPLGLRGSPHLS
jgi:hypothetical protein